jgi:predicted O-methyltransferase YrrM
VDPVEVLRANPHDFHPSSKGEPWAVGADLLRFLADNTPAGGTTFETGLGESTFVFISRSARHIAVGPAAEEAAAIVAFCKEHGVGTEGFDFHCGTSDLILPGLELPELDLVLIDGQHAFPAPFLDWYYTADRLREGGLVAIDDVWIRTGTVLKEFLMAEPEWDLVTDLGRSVVFRRLTAEPVTGKWWRQQPWCHPPVPELSTVQRLRARLHVRTRIKALLGKREQEGQGWHADR